LIGEPGSGKSRLLREWLSANDASGQLAGWFRLAAHGLPYGEYPFRLWSRLVSGLQGKCVEAVDIPAVEEVCRRLAAAEHPVLLVVDDLQWIDPASRSFLADLLVARLPMLAILAYRPSFVSLAPAQPAGAHRRVRLRGLSRSSTRRLVEMLARKAGVESSSLDLTEIVRKARGNPLYVEEAIGHLAALRRFGKPARTLPESLPELLIMRVRWTAERLLPQLEQRCNGWFARERDSVLRDLEQLEEQLAAWLDRLDVIEQAPDSIAQEFLRRLRSVDGQLAVLSLLAGRQRPHHNRLAQGLARLRCCRSEPGGVDDDDYAPDAP